MTAAEAIAKADEMVEDHRGYLRKSRLELFFACPYAVITLIQGWADEWTGIVFFGMTFFTVLMLGIGIPHHRRLKQALGDLISHRRSLEGFLDALPGSTAEEHHFDQAMAALDAAMGRWTK